MNYCNKNAIDFNAFQHIQHPSLHTAAYVHSIVRSNAVVYYLSHFSTFLSFLPLSLSPIENVFPSIRFSLFVIEGSSIERIRENSNIRKKFLHNRVLLIGAFSLCRFLEMFSFFSLLLSLIGSLCSISDYWSDPHVSIQSLSVLRLIFCFRLVLANQSSSTYDDICEQVYLFCEPFVMSAQMFSQLSFCS